MFDIPYLCDKCKKSIRVATSGDIVSLCLECQGYFPTVVKQSDLKEVEVPEFNDLLDKGKKSALDLSEDEKQPGGEWEAQETARKNKSSLDEVTEKVKFKGPPSWKNFADAENNKYGRRKYDKG